MPLLLLPNLLDPQQNPHDYFPTSIAEAAGRLDGLIAESDREGRRFLRRFATKKRAEEIPIALLNEHTPRDDMDFLLEPVILGQTWGVVSDAGLPCLADPGAMLVMRAHERKLPVEAYVGPCSIVLALMQSGLSGQRFSFRGYLPKDEKERKAALLDWQSASKKERSTQIFIEAPYRNEATYKTCLEVLDPLTQFCIAKDLTLPTQFLKTVQIMAWRKEIVTDLAKHPIVFLFSCYKY